jgi:ABC-2 type transport system ATP-binding protein
LVCALQHRPDLLILDEPTSGLDPLVQQTFFELLHEATSEGRTVFFSSHIISEVERVCDRVAIIREGRIVEVDSVHGLQRMAVHHVELRFASAPPIAEFALMQGVTDLSAEDEGRVLRMQVSGPIGRLVTAAARHDLVDVVSREPNLEDIFLAHYGAREAEAQRATLEA